MKLKNIMAIGSGVALGLLVAWWLGLFSHPAPTASSVATLVAAGNAAKPRPMNTSMAVAAPVLPPVAASESAPPTPKRPLSEAEIAALPAAQQQAQILQKANIKKITNNLRQLGTAASQYMLDKGVTSASYFDLVGTGTDNYVRSITPALGEDYSYLIISQTDTQVMVVAPDGTMVTYDM